MKRTMLDLLYPAVLGAVLYTSLTVIFSPIVAGIGRASGGGDQPEMSEAFFAEKASLLIVTFFFYLCDYFYVKFTNDYRWNFFLYSCLFLIGLYITVAAIQMTRNVPPNAVVIAGTYLAFMVLYLLWDLQEWWRCGEGERAFYRFVLIWELFSIAALVIALRRLTATTDTAGLVALLAVITVGFAFVAWWKRQYVHREEAAS